MSGLSLVSHGSFTENSLIQLARQGDTAACHRLLTGMLGQVQRIARRYAVTYQWVAPSLDWQDLVQSAYEEMICSTDRVLALEEPAAYLVGIARRAISRICHRLDREQEEVVSLDACVPGYEEDLFKDIIPESVRPISAYAQETADYEPLYHQIEQLPEKQRLVVERLHGIGCCAPEGMAEVSRACQCTTSTTLYHYRMALGALYFALLGRYNDTCTSSLLENKPGPAQSPSVVPDRNRRRLDKAYDALVARGEKVTSASLRSEAHIDSRQIRAYLHERRGAPQPQKSPRQRLCDAYAALAKRGEKITRQSLLEESHTNRAAVAVYLRQINHSLLKTPQQRMEEAIEALQSQGKRVTGDAIVAEAHVSKTTAHAYLRKRSGGAS